VSVSILAFAGPASIRASEMQKNTGCAFKMCANLLSGSPPLPYILGRRPIACCNSPGSSQGEAVLRPYGQAIGKAMNPAADGRSRDQ
jgi:hypothetical protein